MAHLGHKTEERAHVLNNSDLTLKILKARKKTFLCLCSMVAIGFSGVLLFPHISHAQQSPVYTTGGGSAAQTEIRLQQMETQVRELTGKVEEQLYQINSLKQKINRLERFSQESDVPQAVPSGRLGARQNVTQNSPQQQRGGGDPLNLNPLAGAIAAQQPQGIQTKTVIGGNNHDATAQYEKAYAALKTKDFDSAEQGFDQFLTNHSDHVLAANAKYWLAETHYVRGDYKAAARNFAEGFQTYPDSAKSPDILLKLGMSLKGLGKDKDACVALGQVAVKFPNGHDDVVTRAQQERESLSCGG